ncbi:YcnI family copper-binding membrane protein [Plantactinospora sp. CA-290183]|uniref:YcnI family copper-binding membrane protein n=1 Tax=Plantactinospora sp. CA-290183 TaxID=3240006 RepID=UPI003D8E9A3A
MIRHRRGALSAVALVLGASAVGVFGLAAPASAHVTVNPKEATQGGYAVVNFRVPTESDTAATTKVEVTMPEDAPVATAAIKPVPGWTAAVEKRKIDPPLEVHGSQVTEAVSKITWTASSGAAVKPGEYQEFPVQMGPLPKVDRMVFRALQHYSDGNVVRWIEPPAANGGEAPEDPAPVLTLAAAPAAGAPSTSAPADPAPDLEAAASTGDDDNSLALGLGIAGLIAGLGGLALGGLAFARARRTSVPPAA